MRSPAVYRRLPRCHGYVPVLGECAVDVDLVTTGVAMQPINEHHNSPWDQSRAKPSCRTASTVTPTVNSMTSGLANRPNTHTHNWTMSVVVLWFEVRVLGLVFGKRNPAVLADVDGVLVFSGGDVVDGERVHAPVPK